MKAGSQQVCEPIHADQIQLEMVKLDIEKIYPETVVIVMDKNLSFSDEGSENKSELIKAKKHSKKSKHHD